MYFLIYFTFHNMKLKVSGQGKRGVKNLTLIISAFLVANYS